jgi:hypothetical protein
MATVQVFPDIESQPDQSEKVELSSAIAVRVTVVSLAYAPVQSLPQSIPAGELVTEPFPVPDFIT